MIISIPEELKQIRIDVGLAGEAPNAALWLSETTDRFVIGIEPLPYHWKMINNFETSNSKRPYPDNFKILQLEENVVKLNRQVICDVGNRFFPIEAAIDDVSKVEKKKFYMMDRTGGASGSSSLLEPSPHHPHFIEEEIEVAVHSLEHVLDSIDWDRFEYIEHIKTDCEGKDWDVVKSIGKYLDRVVFITSEMTNNLHHWHGSGDPRQFVEFMQKSGFGVLGVGNGEIVFFNLSLKHKVEEDNLDFNTLGL
tara:strand:- start:1044 stop:1796 length:753 start_codon:yes stop_codon:yes gene_type:complete